MLVLEQGRPTYPDHADEGIRYVPPVGLVPLTGPEGAPQVMVSRGEDGGVLQLRLGPEWPELGEGERAVPLSESRFRLVLRTPAGQETGEWRESPVTGETVVDRSVSMSPVEAAIARRLGTGSGDLVDVEAELTLRGFAPTFPWTVEAPGETLRQVLRAQIGADPVPWEEVEAAFLGLGGDPLTWRPLEPAAVPPPMEAALRAVARHAAPFLLDSSEAGWVVRGEAPQRVRVSLAVPSVDSMRIGLRWSFSAFLAARPDPAQVLVDVSVPAPMEAAELVVVNDVPLAAEGVAGIEVEVRTGGPTGRVRHTFTPGASSAARLRFVRETFEDLALSWRARVTVMTARGAAVVETPSRDCGLSIQIRPADLGLTPLRFRAEPEVFEHAAALECTVGSRTLALTAATQEAWAVGRTAPPTTEVTAVLEGGERVPLGEQQVPPGGLTLQASLLGVGEVATVSLRAAEGAWGRAAYLAVQVEGGPWRTLERGARLEWPVRRENRLHAPRLRYRTRLVPLVGGGRTRPMEESPWRSVEGETVVVGVADV